MKKKSHFLSITSKFRLVIALFLLILSAGLVKAQSSTITPGPFAYNIDLGSGMLGTSGKYSCATEWLYYGSEFIHLPTPPSPFKA